MAEKESTVFQIDPHAVRWELPSVGLLERFTKWHWTLNANRTLCGRTIPVGGEVAFLPETEERQETVNCKGCLKVLGIHGDGQCSHANHGPLSAIIW